MRTRLVGIIALLLCAACDHPANTVTAPSDVSVGTQLFSGTLAVKGSKFYSYSVNEGGTVSVMLASLSPGLGASPASRVELAIGIPAGTGCRPLVASVVGPALVPQLQLSQSPGIYCVSITDTGSLSTPMTFAIRIIHP